MAPHGSQQQPSSPCPQHQASCQPEDVLAAKTSQPNTAVLLADSLQVPFAHGLEQSDSHLNIALAHAVRVNASYRLHACLLHYKLESTTPKTLLTGTIVLLQEVYFTLQQSVVSTASHTEFPWATALHRCTAHSVCLYAEAGNHTG